MSSTVSFVSNCLKLVYMKISIIQGFMMAIIFLRINYTTIPASIKPRLQVWCNTISTFSKANSHFNSLYRPMIIIIDYYKHNYIQQQKRFVSKQDFMNFDRQKAYDRNKNFNGEQLHIS